MDNHYAECIEHNLQYLVNNGKIGKQAIVQNIPNSLLEGLYSYKYFHFLIKIPFGGKNIECEIMFNPEDAAEVPDIAFNNTSVFGDFDINTLSTYVPTFENWDIKKHSSLTNLLNEFVAWFRKIQLMMLETEYVEHYVEYQQLIKNVPEESVEVFIDEIEESVNFLVPLSAGLDEQPKYPNAPVDGLQHAGEDFAHLYVSMSKYDTSKAKVKLQMAPRIEQNVGKPFRLPTYTKNMKLDKYVGLVDNKVKESIKTLTDPLQFKNEFISTVVANVATCLIEYDTKCFEKVVFSYNHDLDDYKCLVIISLAANFPKVKPKVEIASMYCQGVKCSHAITNFPFSISDSMEEIVEKIMDSLRDAVEVFKSHKHI